MSDEKLTISYPKKNELVFHEGFYAFGTKPKKECVVEGVLLSLFAPPIVGTRVEIPSEKGWAIHFGKLQKHAKYMLTVFDAAFPPHLHAPAAVTGIHGIPSAHEFVYDERRKKEGGLETAYVGIMFPSSSSSVCSFMSSGASDEGVNAMKMVRDVDSAEFAGARSTAMPPYNFAFWFEGIPSHPSNTYKLKAFGNSGGSDMKTNLKVIC